MLFSGCWSGLECGGGCAGFNEDNYPLYIVNARASASEITVTFNERIRLGSSAKIESSPDVGITTYTGATIGSLAKIDISKFEISENILILTVSIALTHNELVKVYFAKDAITDVKSNELRDTITTGLIAIDAIAPSISNKAGAKSANKSQVIILFDEIIRFDNYYNNFYDTEGITEIKVVTGTTTGNLNTPVIIVKGEIEIIEDSSRLILTVDTPLINGQLIAVNFGEKQIIDITGNALVEGTTTGEIIVDTVLPTLTSTNPIVTIASDKKIILSFTEAILVDNTSTITGISINTGESAIELYVSNTVISVSSTEGNNTQVSIYVKDALVVGQFLLLTFNNVLNLRDTSYNTIANFVSTPVEVQ